MHGVGHALSSLVGDRPYTAKPSASAGGDVGPSAQRTTSGSGRTITIGPHEARLAAVRLSRKTWAGGQPGRRSGGRSATLCAAATAAAAPASAGSSKSRRLRPARRRG